MLQKWSFTFHDDCQKTMCSLWKCCLKISMLGNKKKTEPTFFSGKISVFSKSCFYPSLRPERSDFITCTITVPKRSKLLYVTFCGLSYLMLREKLSSVFLSLEEEPLFRKNTDFNKLLGANEMILYLAAKIAKTACGAYRKVTPCPL